MKSLLPILLVLGFSGSLLSGQEVPDYFAQYRDTPVPIINRTGGPETELYLVGVEQGDLIFRYSPYDSREIGIPLDTDGLKLFYKPDRNFLQALSLVELGDMRVAVEGMRSGVYPLVQYLDIPTDKINIHQYVERFAFALANSDANQDEAVAFFSRIPLSQLPPAFTQHALRLVEKLIANGDRTSALALMDRLPLSGEDTLLPKLLRFANSLRKDGNIEQALFLYQRMQSNEGTPEAEEALLWIAYCNVELGRVETGKIFLDQAGQLEPGDAGFSLAALIRGNILLLEEKPLEAMKAISRGVVYTDVGADWAPEISFKAGLLYEDLGKPETARAIYDEVLLFYPSTQWGKASQERLQNMPAPEEEQPA